jgi:hypothetical protein
MKRIFLAVVAGCMVSAALPTICIAKEDQKSGWSKWAKVGAAATVVAGICAWLYLDARVQSLLKTATLGSQKQFIEDLKYHAAHNADGSLRVITPETSYNAVPDAEFLKNTTASLSQLNTGFKAELLFYQIGSKLCAMAAALGFYGLTRPTAQEDEQTV